MHLENRDDGLAFAKALAAAGGLANWRAVRTRMMQLGFERAPAWFADTSLCDGIDEICTASADAGGEPSNTELPEAGLHPTFDVRET